MRQPDRVSVRRVDRLRKQQREEAEQRRREAKEQFAVESPRMEADWKNQLGHPSVKS